MNIIYLNFKDNKGALQRVLDLLVKRMIYPTDIVYHDGDQGIHILLAMDDTKVERLKQNLKNVYGLEEIRDLEIDDERVKNVLFSVARNNGNSIKGVEKSGE